MKEYQKRALTVQKLAMYLELHKGRLGQALSELVSPHGIEKHPYKMSDNEFLGHIEKHIKDIENGDDEE